jgi:hypothetical protein
VRWNIICLQKVVFSRWPSFQYPSKDVCAWESFWRRARYRPLKMQTVAHDKKCSCLLQNLGLPSGYWERRYQSADQRDRTWNLSSNTRLELLVHTCQVWLNGNIRTLSCPCRQRYVQNLQLEPHIWQAIMKPVAESTRNSGTVPSGDSRPRMLAAPTHTDSTGISDLIRSQRFSKMSLRARGIS